MHISHWTVAVPTAFIASGEKAGSVPSSHSSVDWSMCHGWRSSVAEPRLKGLSEPRKTQAIMW